MDNFRLGTSCFGPNFWQGRINNSFFDTTPTPHLNLRIISLALCIRQTLSPAREPRLSTRTKQFEQTRALVTFCLLCSFFLPLVALSIYHLECTSSTGMQCLIPAYCKNLRSLFGLIKYTSSHARATLLHIDPQSFHDFRHQSQNLATHVFCGSCIHDKPTTYNNRYKPLPRSYLENGATKPEGQIPSSIQFLLPSITLFVPNSPVIPTPVGVVTPRPSWT